MWCGGEGNIVYLGKKYWQQIYEFWCNGHILIAEMKATYLIFLLHHVQQFVRTNVHMV